MSAHGSMPRLKDDALGPLCQSSSLSYLICAWALICSGIVCTHLVASMLAIFTCSMLYRFVLHSREPSADMRAAFPICKKLDGLFIMHMSIAWALGRHLTGFLCAVVIIFVLDDPHIMRAVVFVASMSSTSVALWRENQMSPLATYVVCNIFALGSFYSHYRHGWNAVRVWLWHGRTACAFHAAVTGLARGDKLSLGYPRQGFVYMG